MTYPGPQERLAEDTAAQRVLERKPTSTLGERAQCPVCWYSIRVVDGKLSPHRDPSLTRFWPFDCRGSRRVGM